MSVLNIEILKLFKRKSTKVLMIIYGVIMIFISAMYLFGEKKLGVSLFTEGQFISASLSVTMGMILPFIALYSTSTSFALDFSKGTIKNMFLLPITKSDIYSGKLLSVQSLIAVLLSVQFAYSLIFGLILDGGFTFAILSAALLKYLGAFLILGLVNLGGAFLSLLVTSTGLAVMLSYLIYIGTNLVSVYFPALKAISIYNILTNYNSLTISLLLSVISYYIILYVVGNIIFEKKEENACQYE